MFRALQAGTEQQRRDQVHVRENSFDGGLGTILDTGDFFGDLLPFGGVLRLGGMLLRTDLAKMHRSAGVHGAETVRDSQLCMRQCVAADLGLVLSVARRRLSFVFIGGRSCLDGRAESRVVALAELRGRDIVLRHQLLSGRTIRGVIETFWRQRCRDRGTCGHGGRRRTSFLSLDIGVRLRRLLTGCGHLRAGGRTHRSGRRVALVD